MNEVRKDAAPGMDDVVMDMILTERLFEVWVALFEFCWEHGRVPTLWRESVIVPVPKKQGRGVYDVNTFRGTYFIDVFGQQGFMQDSGEQIVRHGGRQRTHS